MVAHFPDQMAAAANRASNEDPAGDMLAPHALNQTMMNSTMVSNASPYANYGQNILPGA